jgi:predicted metal-binding protein
MIRDPRADDLLREASEQLTHEAICHEYHEAGDECNGCDLADRIRAYLDEPQSEPEYVIVKLRREDAYAVVLGPLDYTLKKQRGEAPSGGSPMRLRNDLFAQIGPWEPVSTENDPLK